MTPSPHADQSCEPEAGPDLAAKVAFLRRPATHGVTGVEALETHMSWVFLAGDHVLKLKKPVRFPFLDFSTLAAREHDCREEVRLNARLARGVYLGLRALQWNGTSLALVSPQRVRTEGRTVDWLVLMRRLPADQMLDVRIAAGRVTPEDIDPVVALLGRFYRHARTVPVPTEEYVAHFHREQAANREVLLRPQFGLQHATTALDRMDRALVDHAELLYERSAGGRIVDGHGDLRPEHVCLFDPPVIIDCLEFNAALRCVDPFDEAACLGLECDLGGAPWIGPRLVAGLVRLLEDRPTPALVRLYTAHRALLRARLAMAHLLDPHPRIPAKWPPLAQRYVQRALAALDELAGQCPLEDAPHKCPSAGATQPTSTPEH